MDTAQPSGLTPAEGTLAQAYVETLDFVSRCAQALDEGN
jgi:hypothetical protein